MLFMPDEVRLRSPAETARGVLCEKVSSLLMSYSGLLEKKLAISPIISYMGLPFKTIQNPLIPSLKLVDPLKPGRCFPGVAP